MSDIEEISACTMLEDFKSSNTSNKLHSAKNCKTIILCLGKQRTISEFVPFLYEYCDDEEDVVLIEILKQIKEIILFVEKNEYESLFALWEKIALMEETSVKNQAVLTFQELIGLFDVSPSMQNFFEAILTRFHKGKDYYMFSHILPYYCGRLGSIPDSMLQLLIELSLSEEFTINNTLIKLLDHYIPILKVETFTLIINNLLKKKEYDSVIRVNLVKPVSESLGHFYPASSNLQVNEEYSSLIISMLKDEDLRVKKNILIYSANFLQSKSNTIHELCTDLIISAFSNQDIEIKLRVCNSLPAIINVLSTRQSSAVTMSLIVNTSTSAVKDPNSKIRKSYAESLLKISPYFSKSDINKLIIPPFLELVKDDNMEIRVALLHDLELLNKQIPIEEIFDSIYVQILDITQNKSWRFRNMLKQVYEIFGKCLKQTTIINKVFPIYLSWLSDPVYAIRKDGIKIVADYLKTYKDSVWPAILEKCIELKGNSSYLYKVTLAQFIDHLLFQEDLRGYVEKYLIGILLELAKSNISNVAINCERAIREFQSHKDLKDEIKLIIMIIEKHKASS